VTEAEWLTSDDPVAMLQPLKGKAIASPRKLRLFVCASLRRAFANQPDVLSVIEVAERFLEGQATLEERRAAIAQVGVPQEQWSMGSNLVWHCLNAPLEDRGYRLEWWHYAVVAALCSKQEQTAGENAVLLRDVFFTPLIRRMPRIRPSWLSWNNETIPRLAQTIYEDRELPSANLDKKRMAVLADALTDAGCTDAAILDHLSNPGPHVRGCFVIDALTGRS
jgi:hypothetical protein